MLKSITIESWDCSLRELDGNAAAKKLTLLNNGHVIYVEKDFGDKENTSIITHKTFNKETVQNFLDKAEKIFIPDFFLTDTDSWCDACPDVITLKKQDGEIIQGELFNVYNKEVEAFYYLIGKTFNIELGF